jgi:nucleotide-binding universal stress UspA family protein
VSDALGSDLILLTVAEDREAAIPYLESVAGSLRAEGRTVGIEAREGRVPEAITGRAAEDDVGLAVLTTFAGKGDSHHLGATADRLARTLSKPALFISPLSQARAPITGPLIVGLDGSPTAEAVLDSAAELAAQLKLPLRLVRVEAWAKQLFAAFTGLAPPQADDEIELGSNTYLAALLDRLPATPDSNYQTLRGNAAEMLVEYARNQGGILVLCSHGQSASHLWHLGSTTDKVLRISAEPVLMIPAQHPSRQAAQSP